MIAVDANILLRSLVTDDRQQLRSVDRLIASLDDRAEQAFVSDIVLVEIAWVLKTGYGLQREEIAHSLGQLLEIDQLRFDSTEKVVRALQAYEQGPGDFADYLIREHARAAGCTTVATFDRKLHKDEMFSAP